MDIGFQLHNADAEAQEKNMSLGRAYAIFVLTHRKTCCLYAGLFTIFSAFEPIGIAQASAVCEGVALLVLLVVVPHRCISSADTLCPESFIWLVVVQILI